MNKYIGTPSKNPELEQQGKLFEAGLRLVQRGIDQKILEDNLNVIAEILSPLCDNHVSSCNYIFFMTKENDIVFHVRKEVLAEPLFRKAKFEDIKRDYVSEHIGESVIARYEGIEYRATIQSLNREAERSPNYRGEENNHAVTMEDLCEALPHYEIMWETLDKK